ncbi:cysteine synthase family protein [Romboutsia sp.]|uniref:cysteine synthase family protein n=1 Tax=Romboutsia sp. TaxID=1965302 RepID=UPI002C701548|nr:cysteine synthase family protein [Romboutsia sp.]HSQ89594.1 cysteine synthase family protein [Romboutsia sp.]
MYKYKTMPKDIAYLTGNTPMIEVIFKYKGQVRYVYAKVENFNMTGSIKDRMQINILRNAYNTGELKPGYKIVEASSGNTAIALSAMGTFLNHEVSIYMPSSESLERKQIIESFGAKLNLVDSGFEECLRLAKIEGQKSNVYYPDQFANPWNPQAHYCTTGPEIWQQLKSINKVANAFVAGIGTGGTIMGTGRYLRKKNPYIGVFPVQPKSVKPFREKGNIYARYDNNAYLYEDKENDFINDDSNENYVVPESIPGISSGTKPEIVNLNELNNIVIVDDSDAYIMAQKLASNLGMGVGPSSGANLIGAIVIQDKLGLNSTVATVFADDNKKYLSTDLTKKIKPKEHYISSNVELIGVRSINRICIKYNF